MGPDSQAPGSSGTGIAQAHDRYFRAGLQGRAEQVALIGSLFPTLVPLLDADSVTALDGTFVDEELTLRQTDLALQVRLAGRDVIVYVLVEHQSSVDPLMALRMLRYQVRIWDRYLQANETATKVPAILPAVVYQGRRAWTAATDLRDLLDLDPATDAELAEFLPRLPYRLDDWGQIDVAGLRARPVTAALRLIQLLLTQVSDQPDLLAFLETLHDDLVEVAAAPGGAQQLYAAFTYIVNVSDVSTEELHPLASRLGPVVQEALMTTAEKLRAEGRVEGRVEGRAEGQAELLLEQLTVKFGPQPVEVQARVFTATSDQLHTWARRILAADSIDEVLD